MCIIAHREPGSGHIPNKVLRHNRQANPDGFGIAWRDAATRQLLYEKFGPTEYKEFKHLVKTIDRQKEVEYVLHFRKATHGPVCTDMSHPFAYDDAKEGTTLVFHNGIINNSPPKGESDTSHFVKQVLTQLVSKWWTKEAYRFLIQNSIGWSRLVIMTESETIRLASKMSDWQNVGGLWYSATPAPGMSSATMTPFIVGQPRSARDAWDTWEDTSEDDDEFGFDDDDYEDEFLPFDYMHEGHQVSRISGYEPDDWKGEMTGQAICNECQTIGSYYRIEGQTFTELTHYKDVLPA